MTAERAIEPHPPDDQTRRTKWLIRRHNPVERKARSPSPVPMAEGLEAVDAAKVSDPEAACGDGERIVGG